MRIVKWLIRSEKHYIFWMVYNIVFAIYTAVIATWNFYINFWVGVIIQPILCILFLAIFAFHSKEWAGRLK